MSDRDSATEALDEFFRIIRDKAAADQAFAVDLIKALGVPIKINMQPKDFSKTLPYLDPVVIAASGYDEFREVFMPLSAANLRKLLTTFNFVDKEAVPARGGPEKAELFDMLWSAASKERGRAGG